jgi:hypothetical protein
MCGFFYRLLRLLTKSPSASLAATLLLAFSRTLWKFAVVTEVYALHLLLAVLILYGIAVARTDKKRWGLVLASLAFGLGLAHHPTIVLLLPIMIALWPRGRLAARISLGTIFVCVVAPLLLYLLLPVMAANTPQYSETGFHFRDFVRTVSRAEYRERGAQQNVAEEPLVRPRDILRRSFDFLGKQFGWIVFALCVIGWFFASAGRRIWAFWGAVTVLLWIIAVSFFSRGSPLGMPFSFLRSVDEFLLPVNVFLAMGLAFLLAPAAQALTSRADFGGTEGQNFIPSRYIPIVIALLFCVIPLFTAMVNLRYSSMSHHTFTQDQSRNVLEQAPENGVLVVSGDESFLFDYLQEVRGIREDVELLAYPFSLTVEGTALPAANSLAYFINKQLGDRACLFSFSPPAAILPYLEPPRALRLDGVAYTLIDAQPGMPEFTIGDPNIWLHYNLRNLNPSTLDPSVQGTLVPDDFEYETLDRYVNGLLASVALLDERGYMADESRNELALLAVLIRASLANTDYPSPAARPAPQEGQNR